MTRSQDFADALHRLEQDGDVDTFAASFSDDAVLLRPEPGNGDEGADGARQFWQAYLDQFETIASTFSRVAEDGDLGELEWVGEGRLRTGRDISYAGVSLLSFTGDGKVERFATYYDTAAFSHPG